MQNNRQSWASGRIFCRWQCSWFSSTRRPQCRSTPCTWLHRQYRQCSSITGYSGEPVSQQFPWIAYLVCHTWTSTTPLEFSFADLGRWPINLDRPDTRSLGRGHWSGCSHCLSNLWSSTTKRTERAVGSTWHHTFTRSATSPLFRLGHGCVLGWPWGCQKVHCRHVLAGSCQWILGSWRCWFTSFVLTNLTKKVLHFSWLDTYPSHSWRCPFDAFWAHLHCLCAGKLWRRSCISCTSSTNCWSSWPNVCNCSRRWHAIGFRNFTVFAGERRWWQWRRLWSGDAGSWGWPVATRCACCLQLPCLSSSPSSHAFVPEPRVWCTVALGVGSRLWHSAWIIGDIACNSRAHGWTAWWWLELHCAALGWYPCSVYRLSGHCGRRGALPTVIPGTLPALPATTRSVTRTPPYITRSLVLQYAGVHQYCAVQRDRCLVYIDNRGWPILQPGPQRVRHGTYLRVIVPPAEDGTHNTLQAIRYVETYAANFLQQASPPASSPAPAPVTNPVPPAPPPWPTFTTPHQQQVWINELEEAFLEHSHVECEEEGKVLYAAGWFINNANYRKCPVPQMTKLMADSHSWFEEVMQLWAHQFQPDAPVRIHVVQPYPPAASHRAFAIHLLIEQNLMEGKAANIVSFHVQGHLQDQLWQSALSLPRWVATEDLIDATELNFLCETRRCTAVCGRMHFQRFIREEIASGMSIEIFSQPPRECDVDPTASSSTRPHVPRTIHAVSGNALIQTSTRSSTTYSGFVDRVLSATAKVTDDVIDDHLLQQCLEAEDLQHDAAALIQLHLSKNHIGFASYWGSGFVCHRGTLSSPYRGPKSRPVLSEAIEFAKLPLCDYCTIGHALLRPAMCLLTPHRILVRRTGGLPCRRGPKWQSLWKQRSLAVKGESMRTISSCIARLQIGSNNCLMPSSSFSFCPKDFICTQPPMMRCALHGSIVILSLRVRLWSSLMELLGACFVFGSTTKGSLPSMDVQRGRSSQPLSILCGLVLLSPTT